MVPPSEHSLDVAEPCLPSSLACGLEDSEPGRSRPEKEGRKEEVPERQSREENGYSELQRGSGALADTS